MSEAEDIKEFKRERGQTIQGAVQQPARLQRGGIFKVGRLALALNGGMQGGSHRLCSAGVEGARIRPSQVGIFEWTHGPGTHSPTGRCAELERRGHASERVILGSWITARKRLFAAKMQTCHLLRSGVSQDIRGVGICKRMRTTSAGQGQVVVVD